MLLLHWLDCNLTSLKGAPKIIKTNFYCHCNYNLTSLEGGPERVSMNYYCDNCPLETLKGFPKKIGRELFISRNCPVFKEMSDGDIRQKIQEVCSVGSDIVIY